MNICFNALPGNTSTIMPIIQSFIPEIHQIYWDRVFYNETPFRLVMKLCVDHFVTLSHDWSWPENETCRCLQDEIVVSDWKRNMKIYKAVSHWFFLKRWLGSSQARSWEKWFVMTNMLIVPLFFFRHLTRVAQNFLWPNFSEMPSAKLSHTGLTVDRSKSYRASSRSSHRWLQFLSILHVNHFQEM